MQRSRPAQREARRDLDIGMAAGGLVALLAGMVVVRDGHIPSWERDLFDAVNGLPGFLEPVLWPFQQLGALVAGPVVALAALALKRYRLAAAAVAVTVGKLVGERLVKALVSRSRPFTSIGPDITLRGDVERHGESFVSGHAILISALAGIIAPYLPGRWRLLPWLIVALVAFARVYVGAHLPFDVIGGVGLGLLLAGLANLTFGVSR